MIINRTTTLTFTINRNTSYNLRKSSHVHSKHPFTQSAVCDRSDFLCMTPNRNCDNLIPSMCIDCCFLYVVRSYNGQDYKMSDSLLGKVFADFLSL